MDERDVPRPERRRCILIKPPSCPTNRGHLIQPCGCKPGGSASMPYIRGSAPSIPSLYARASVC